MSVEVLTFGCRLNAYESRAIAERAREAGLTNAVVVNSCAVTAEAVRQSRQAIRKARRERPGARIIVTGCAAQTEPETYAAMAEVDRVLGNQEKLARESYAAFGLEAAERVRVNDIMALRETAPQFLDSFEGRTRAFLQVQNGCDHRCTFCIIPFARGPARSVPMGAAIDEAGRLVAAGFSEIVLTGVDLTAYGADLPGAPRLGTLVRKLLKFVPDLKRLRLSSIDSIEADPALMAALAEEDRLMPHLHLSLQSGDDMILKRMKRRHSRKDTLAFCAEARRLRPDIAFGADLIAGFPTESEAMFENTLGLVDEAGLSFLHVFPFSARKGTPAARMPALDPKLVRGRARRLREKAKAAGAQRLSALAGSTKQVLVEKESFGRTPCFAPVAVEGEAPAGSIISARLEPSADGGLRGRAA
ncbi:MAG: tRNA (N(6)-L-threonylcarbamoyladenosine(37)-C(2))-methylthiotransferase MtaB [Alphaproteobacteria bacterium]|nr:tRNA (N(6)-L-threonylcarbamoyladenosine(37)-C(2))-methylthiotransferase MtaB [Alphaproteobacteria bacterium]